MSAHTPLPAASVDPYLAAAIADEIQLGRLFGYKVQAPHEITSNCTIWASKGSSFASFSGPAMRSNDKVWLPKWRRSNECFELISICEMQITCTETGVGVCCPGFPVQHAIYSTHPSKDAAIRYAMCKAAIAYLQIKERGA